MGHYQALLRLNPEDNQAVRFALFTRLIELNHDGPAEKLLDEYGDNTTAVALYSRALLAYRAGGDGPSAQAALRTAREANPDVVDYLLGREESPPILPESYQLGGQDEAVLCAAEILNAWRATLGAVEWLEEQDRKTALRAEKRRRQSRRRKRRQ